MLIVFCIYKFYSIICGYSTTVSATAFQAEDVGSIPITRSTCVVVLLLDTLNIVAGAVLWTYNEEPCEYQGLISTPFFSWIFE